MVLKLSLSFQKANTLRGLALRIFRDSDLRLSFGTSTGAFSDCLEHLLSASIVCSLLRHLNHVWTRAAAFCRSCLVVICSTRHFWTILFCGHDLELHYSLAHLWCRFAATSAAWQLCFSRTPWVQVSTFLWVGCGAHSHVPSCLSFIIFHYSGFSPSAILNHLILWQPLGILFTLAYLWCRFPATFADFPTMFSRTPLVQVDDFFWGTL